MIERLASGESGGNDRFAPCDELKWGKVWLEMWRSCIPRIGCEEEDEDQAIEDVVGQVLAEIGMDMSGAMASAPGRTPVAEAEPEGELSLEERLKNLKG